MQLHTDILVIGGSLGGCAAALGACALGKRVVLTEETDWLGGQLTSQAVPPDEHPWIEQFGCTRRYRQFRQAVRAYYKQHYPLTSQALRDSHLNPGNGHVSRLCHEPRVALAVLDQMLAAYRSRGQLIVLLNHKISAADVDRDRINGVTLLNLDTGQPVTIEAKYFLDATELGDVLPLAGVEYVSGAESQRDTSEPHAVQDNDGRLAGPGNVQALTWCFPMAFDPRPPEVIGSRYLIEKPAQYEKWRDQLPAMTPPWCGPLLIWNTCSPRDVSVIRRNVLLTEDRVQGDESRLWLYRRIVCADHYEPHARPFEVTLVNWPQNDYLEGNLIDARPEDAQRYLHDAKQLSLSLFYWMQTDAPRPKGGQGYPGLHLRPDLVGTSNGLAKAPYIRESRRIRAVFTVTENHVGLLARGGQDPSSASPSAQDIHAEPFFDSVGLGCYRIDLHPSTGGDNYIDISSLPYQIPLGALIPQRVNNLLAACKNIGSTHISNGCYRLHPTEWNIGESAAMTAAYCLEHNTIPRAVRENRDQLAELQNWLTYQGVELAWPHTFAV
ncbi:MAG: FAD-dependent oxidoreductase [Phycisphaeraceae bacterium]|nr:FAD-dependent oxidoreductase [Phycisphaeraceae bacterium]